MPGTRRPTREAVRLLDVPNAHRPQGRRCAARTEPHGREAVRLLDVPDALQRQEQRCPARAPHELEAPNRGLIGCSFCGKTSAQSDTARSTRKTGAPQDHVAPQVRTRLRRRSACVPAHVGCPFMGGGHSTSTSSSKTLKFAGHTSEGKANAKVGVVTRSFDKDKIGLRTHG